MSRLVAACALGLLLVGCGDDEKETGSGSPVLERAVAKTEAAQTARFSVNVTITGGGENSRISGEGVADFERQRDLMTVNLEGQQIQLFNDGGEEYFRAGRSGAFRPFPERAQTPVANNPSDSLKYLGTDVIDVRRARARCYEGKLDFDRVLARAEEGREDELPEQVRGKTADVLICLDSAGRISRYDVNAAIEGSRFDARTRIFDHGRARPLGKLAG